MKKFSAIIAVILLLSGCSLSSTFTVGSDGSVVGTTSFAVPKSALRNVTTVEQWSQVLTENNISSPTPTPDPSLSESTSAAPIPTPSASCAAGEDNQLGQWTYTCTASGDISLLGSSTSIPGAGSLNFERNGSTLTIVQQPSSGSDDSSNPIGLTGVSLFYTTTTITFPGEVTAVSPGAQKIDDHTVSFSSDENQKTALSASVSLTSFTSTPTSLSLTTNASAGIPSGADIYLTAALATPVDGQIEFFDGDVSLPGQTIGADGTAVLLTENQQDGTHNYRAVFKPTNWWALDKSEATSSITVKSFEVIGMPKILGTGKVGAQLSIGSLKTSPAASSVSYQWLRNGKVISGKTGSKYKIVAADFNKKISVRTTSRKGGYLPVTLNSSRQIRISKR
jgi:hypothetical protein